MNCNNKKTECEIELAPQSGFCFGVSRAVELVTQALAQQQNVYSLGAIIHNPQEMKRLEKLGLRIVEGLGAVEGGTLVIRSHGLAPEVVAEAKRKGLAIVDATCPLVSRAQKIARMLTEQGYEVFIVGDARHPEVEAICRHAPQAKVLSENKDLPKDSRNRKIGVLAQTTESPGRFRELVKRIVDGGFKEVRAFSTICPSTIERQEAAVALARRVEIMFVLGGRNSANTDRLAHICRQTGVQTFILEDFDDLRDNKDALAALGQSKRIGVTAGASTPDWLIQDFIGRLREHESRGCQ